MESPHPANTSWWRTAVVYQVYLRSFFDANGDGIGDLAGLRSHLRYLSDLGVDAIWLNPWYESPFADGGYDVVDYRSIAPVFGTLQEAEALIAEAGALGIRTIVDIVPNHVSDAHPWFREALAAEPRSAARERFWFHPGKGEDGSVIPTGWDSEFAGNTWSRTTGPDGSPGEWYLHLFSPQQPDLNWNHPDVLAWHEDALRFWFERGVAGFRIDSAALLIKDPALPELTGAPGPGEHPYQDRDEVHDVYRAWRSIADSYDPPRVLVGEVWLPDWQRFEQYLRPDELHTAFNFDFMTRPWQADSLRTSIDTTLDAHRGSGAPATWVLSNHDVTRPVTRYGRASTGFSFAGKKHGEPSDLDLGTRRARAAALLVAALPGSLYIYQGDELGLPEVEDLPDGERTDPMFLRSHGTNPGRDGCRVPLPWSGNERPYGFSRAGGHQPWLTQPDGWGDLTVAHQEADPASMLALYRAALALRRELPGLTSQDFAWLPSVPGVLSFRRGEVTCLVNLSDHDVALPEHRNVALSSGPLEGDHLPPDTTVWLT